MKGEYELNEDLKKLFEKYGCDKQLHGYDNVYQSLFKNIKGTVESLLEIGIGTLRPDFESTMHGYALDNYSPGGSLRAWQDYFNGAQIIGFDIDEEILFSEDRISTFLIDSTKTSEVNAWNEEYGEVKFDIIIDDGSHNPKDQIKTLENLFPLVRDGGYYFVEDVWARRNIALILEQVSDVVGTCSVFSVLGFLNSSILVFSK